ncbi:hypothetical protein [Miniimonas sp. S16]|uniref:hypothetical protein n=1 Tax=Miniimonas sp. S16 TaxID=2171623 RepID=UPI000D5264A8|nr:hypothetical protein [Miniimonas sp. S16]
MHRRLRLATAALALAVGALTACSGFAELPADPAASASPGALVAGDLPDVILSGDTAGTLAVSASQEFFTTAGIVVLTPADEASQVRAASIAMLLGVPALVMGDGADDAVATELTRLGTHTVLVVDGAEVPELGEDRPLLRAVQAPRELSALQVVLGHDLAGEEVIQPEDAVEAIADAQAPFDWLLTTESTQTPSPDASAPALADLPGLPPVLATARLADTVTVSDGGAHQVAALGTARAAGSAVVVTDEPVLADSAASARIYGLQPTRAVGVGDVGTLEALSYEVAVAATGTQLPGGGQLLLPGSVYVGVRGTAGSGFPDWDALASTAGQIADGEGVPTAEVITTVVTSSRGRSGTYSARAELAAIRDVVAVAQERGVMVLLAFQPGRESFLDQVQAYADVLGSPNVGLVLEPRWRLAESETPESHGGTFGDAEVAGVVDWLADLTRDAALPPKLVVVRSPVDASAMVTSRPEVNLVVQVDGEAVTPASDVPGAPAAVSAGQVWEGAVVPGPAWWGWWQGANAVSLGELQALNPAPVVVTSGS